MDVKSLKELSLEDWKVLIQRKRYLNGLEYMYLKKACEREGISIEEFYQEIRGDENA